MTNQEQAQLLELIGKGKIAKAIDGLLSMGLNDSSKQQAVSISHRYKKLEREKRSNIITFEQADVAESKIANDLIDLINHANDEPPTEEKSNDENKSSKSTIWKYITAAAVIMGILGSLAEVVNFINIIPNGKSGEILQLTVFVTNTKGNVVLEHEGRLNASLGNRSLNEVIGANGRTNFPDITADKKGDTITIGLQAEGWEIIGDNTFVFTGEPIQLKVKKDDSLGVVKGIVKSRDGQEFIEGAKIMIGVDTAVFSRQDGTFKILLPENMRVKKDTDGYRLTASKAGYKTFTDDYYPKSADAELRLEKK